MESYQIPKSSDNVMCQETYEFSAEDLADIPCPDEICSQAEGSSPEDYIELPLPPGTSEDDFPIPLPPKQDLVNKVSNTFSPSLPVNKAFENTSDHKLVPENLDILAFNDNDKQKCGGKEDDLADLSVNKGTDFFYNSKYSPSKMDSDEENQDFITIKPKVLGKEQAKKRLMAFSLSKQPSASVKKQSKAVTPAKSKEKPPNPNKGSNVQEQFRATISAIEEEKKKMFQNMPSYLLLEMSELAKSSHSSMSTSVQLLEKLKNESADSKNKESTKEGNSNRTSERGKTKTSFKKSRSRSNSRSRKSRRNVSKRRSRSRSRSRSRRSHSRSRRRSPNRNHSSRSQSRRSRDKTYKTDNHKVLRENYSTPKKKLFEDWSSFKAAGMVLDSQRDDEHRKRSRSPSEKSDFKPIFSYFNKRNGPMTVLQAKSLDSASSSPALFLEKTIKYTRTKPILCWAENPSVATEFYMSKQMLLENCDETTMSLLLPIIESKSLTKAQDIGEQDVPGAQQNRHWYPREENVMAGLRNSPKKSEENESHHDKKTVEMDNTIKAKPEAVEDSKKELNTDIEGAKKEKSGFDKKISLVNDSYLSDEEDQVKEMIVGDVKVKMNFDLNRVKVRSKWDSDNEGENSEKKSILHKEDKKKSSTKVQVEGTMSNETHVDDMMIPPYSETLNDSFDKRKPPPPNLSNLNVVEPVKGDTSEITEGKLVSEYEEFLKMVSVDANDNHDDQKEKIIDPKLKTEKLKLKKSEKPSSENQKAQTPKLGFTDWDQESDHDDKSNSKKIQLTNATASHDDFLISKKNEKSDVKLEKSKKKPLKKKTEKLKSGKKKLLKKSNKAKKKKMDDSYSEDSTSDSYDSESDSDTDDSDSSGKKKKKKKISKAKKKSKKGSTSESDSDSDDSEAKKKKPKKKRSGRKKSSTSSSSSSSSEVSEEETFLKQLDFKKQLIMKKIEEIDSIGDKNSKRKENRAKKKEKDSSNETDSEADLKSGKKKKTDVKITKDKKKTKQKSKKGKLSGKNKKSKKSSSSSESESESSDESTRKKKSKRAGKRKRDSSESSDSDETAKSKSKSSKTSKKGKKSKRHSSSSDSDDSDDSVKDKKKVKKGSKSHDENNDKEPELEFKDKLITGDGGIKSEEQSALERKNLWAEKSKKVREDDDWEASSSVAESEQECKTRDSCWDEDVALSKSACADDGPKTEKKRDAILPEKDFILNTSTNMSEVNNQLASETLKNSLSNFSFNENSFCSFGQELSRDFFLAERSYSNSGNISDVENLKTSLIEPRPFQSVSKESEIRNPTESELYSPGYSDSEVSETETNKFDKGNAENGKREDVYDPLNCDSEASQDNNEIELSSIPLPRVADILLPGEPRSAEPVGMVYSSNSESTVLKDVPRNETEKLETKPLSILSPVKSCFTASDFTPVVSSQSPINEEKITPTKRQLMSVKGQHKLISKAASVFRDESDEENIEPQKKGVQDEMAVNLKEKIADESKKKLGNGSVVEEKIHTKKSKKESRDRSRERSNEREERRRRSRSRERNKSHSKKAASPSKKRKSKTPELNREKREIRSDSFEIEPLKSSMDSNELAGMVQPIPVLTGLETTSSEALWSRSLGSICEFPHSTDNLIDHAESFDIYPSEESKLRNRSYDKDYLNRDKTSREKSREPKSKKERRKSRSRSYSPRKKVRSKSPERRKSPRSRSPRRKSASPKRRDKSPFSPRRRSPKRKSPSRRYKSSRSPDKKRKSPSRSPRKRRSSPSRRSRSVSPRKYRSPKRRDESPRRKDSPRMFSPRDRFSPRKDVRYVQPYSDGLQNRIPVIGTSSEDVDMEVSPSALRSPFEASLGFSQHMADPSVMEPEMYNSFYEGEYSEEFGARSYSEEVGVNNLITVKNHDIEKANTPERLSLDQRIELELRVPMSGSQSQTDQYQMPNQVCPPFQEMSQNHYQNSYNCDTNLSSDNFYHNQNVQMNTDFNGQYFNGHQQQQQPPPSYVPFSQYPNSQPVQNSVLQVGNIVEVVPTLQHPPPSLPAKSPQIMQVGNVLQVVPSQKATPPVYGPTDPAPMVKTQKATAVVAPSSIVPTPNHELILNPLIKAIQLEREKRRKEKEKRKAEREARRKARQLRREAKLMSVNEKLKKSVQNEGLMLGQEVEDDELLDGLDVPSPPIPVEIITVSSPSALPPAGKGILITAGFMPKPPSEKKEVKFADGVCPGEGTSTSGGEEIASPPPKPKLPKEKRFKKKKTKLKKKVKVQIIRQIIQEEDDDEDDLSPPPPPPGDPPPVFFARFPFAGDAQFPVYQTQTTTTLTTVQYPAQTFE